MRSIATCSVFFILLAPLGAPSRLHMLDPVDKSDVDCGCTFFEFDASVQTEIYVEGSEVLFFDFTSIPPRAIINYGQGNVELLQERSSSLPFKSCNSGEPFSSEWKLDELAVLADLKATVADGEACWFGGDLRLTGLDVAYTVTISGACQC